MHFLVSPRTTKPSKMANVVCTAAVLFLMSAGGLFLRADMAPTQLSPGSQSDGTVLLANGWRLAPAGKLLNVGNLPLNLAQTRDSRYLVVTNAGLAQPSFTVVDAATWTVKQTINLGQAWYGLAWHPTLPRLYLAGAAGGNVREWAIGSDGVMTPLRTFTRPSSSTQNFSAGIAVNPDGKTLYVTDLFLMTLTAMDATGGQILAQIALPAEPYTVLPSSDGASLYVSLWGGSRVQVYDASTLQLKGELHTSERPNALALSNDGKRLFVACGGDSSVWSFDTSSLTAIEQISTSLYPMAPKTATPNALSLSPDGNTLLAANADNNAVAVIDVSNVGHAVVNGFIPTSWYPTGVLFSRDGKQIFILAGKGDAPAPDRSNNQAQTRLTGSIAVLNTPDRTTLAAYTRTVYQVTPYTDKSRLRPSNAPVGSPVPVSVGGTSPIHHVIYVIRENRTYDQILGDMKQGNGDPTLTMWGAGLTPNAHSLSQNFVLFDNFYVDAEVSYDGHAFSTAAYANDFIQKIWQTYYGARGAQYLGEGGGFFRNPYGNISAPTGGYIWDHANAAHVTVRSYGEFADNVKSGTDVTASASVPGLAGAVAPKFAAFDVTIQDVARYNAWASEFQAYVASGQLPQLSIVHLGNDHTAGATPGYPTPRAMVGENDYALGKLVETVSNSVFWKDTAIFVLEDDSQSGPDHVDSHRSVLLVASPYARRGFVDHTFYTTSGVLRTMELILGLEPMSQYDAAATPLYNAFQGTPNLGAYSKLSPNVAFDEKNTAQSVGAGASLAMDFSDADRTPEQALNEILWHAQMGDRPMPPPRRSVFARPRN